MELDVLPGYAAMSDFCWERNGVQSHHQVRSTAQLWSVQDASPTAPLRNSTADKAQTAPGASIAALYRIDAACRVQAADIGLQRLPRGNFGMESTVCASSAPRAAQAFARFCTGLREQPLHPAAVERAKHFFIDYMG